ncbi:PREDICTED: putative F-box protein At4g21240 [Camelina sativa]|uniref:F-box protein At4g21240 n=1 Tax=Camelina sativa TaxID=90675 RepID=A0ABM0V5P1_CAMSA|nr:PREDICTED: putative F-box protein At4g21240 [Camelina sativa]
MAKGDENLKVIHRIKNSSSAYFHGDDKYDNTEKNSDHEYIPIDLTREILMRLPAKSILRFRCVSKLWLSITTEQDFINSFTVRQSSIPSQSLLLNFTSYDNERKHVFCMLPFHEKSTSYSDVHNFHIIPPGKDYQSCSSTSVNGLITFGNKTEIVIWNPTMKEHITLLKPKNPMENYKIIGCRLGYDPMENIYKLLLMAYYPCAYKLKEEYQNPQILTLGSQESWRVIKNSPDHQASSDYYCIKGVVYYRANISFEEDRDDHSVIPSFPKAILVMKLKEIIMSFDVRSEQFKSIQIPGRAPRHESNLHECLMSYQGKLAWVCSYSNIIKIWVWQDAEKQEWSENEFVIPMPIRDLVGRTWSLNGATSAGEFIYVAKSGKLFKDISVFIYDPVRETIRNVKGLDYEKFRRCYGSSNERMYFLTSYPDHIESLISPKTLV